MDILQEVTQAWGWTGIKPTEVVTENDFGNLILKDDDDQFWRICPEDAYCEVVAASIDAYNSLIDDDEFVNDWFMDAVVAEATKAAGELEDGEKYHLVISGALNGDYKASNIAKAPFSEVIRKAGELAEKIKDLPDGTKVQLTEQS